MSQRRAHEKTSASATSADADEKAFSPVSPQITEKEVEDVEERSSPRTPVIYETVRRVGDEEMARPVISLWWSGVAAGLSISFSLLAEAVLYTHLPDQPWRPLVSNLGYSVGFIMVVLSRQQLFTENTITVVLPVMADFTYRNFGKLCRLWTIVLAANIVGTFAAAAFTTYTSVVTPELRHGMLEISGAPGLTEDDATKVSKMHSELPNVGDAEAAIAGAEVSIDVEYATPTEHHNPIELFSTTCVWTGDRLTIYEPSQFIYGLKNDAARRVSTDPDKVRVVSHYLGGAFGSKGSMTPRTGIIALAAKRLNRPVKLVASRSQGFYVATYRAETRHHVRLGARRDGKLVGYSHEGWEISSRPDPYVVAGVDDTARLYAFGAVKTKVTIVHADRGTPGFVRSPPVVPYVYALEAAMDELAIKLNMDPVEFRRVNDTMTDPVSGKPFSSRSLMKCYDEAAAAFGWSGRNPRPASMTDGEWQVGWGCATALYPTHVGPTAVRVRLLPDGSVTVGTAAHEIGNGAYSY